MEEEVGDPATSTPIKSCSIDINRDFKQHVRGALRRRRLHMGDWIEDALVVTFTQTLSSTGPDNVYSVGNVWR